jgi:hypothetical protein
MGEKRNAYGILVGKLEGPRRRWVDNIEMNCREIEWDGMDWIDLVQDRDQWRALVNMVMKFWVPKIAADLASPQEGISSISK